jgi:hypothetical protein
VPEAVTCSPWQIGKSDDKFVLVRVMLLIVASLGEVGNRAVSSAGRVMTIYGETRNREDLADGGSLDPLIVCSAEPSVQTRLGGDRYLIDTNLVGTSIASITPVATMPR